MKTGRMIAVLIAVTTVAVGPFITETRAADEPGTTPAQETPAAPEPAVDPQAAPAAPAPQPAPVAPEPKERSEISAEAVAAALPAYAADLRNLIRKAEKKMEAAKKELKRREAAGQAKAAVADPVPPQP